MVMGMRDGTTGVCALGGVKGRERGRERENENGGPGTGDRRGKAKREMIQTSSAAPLHFSVATCCVVPWISGTFSFFASRNSELR